MVETITTDELAQRIEQQPVTLVDVREVYEYRAGHVPGAVNIPLSLIPLRVQELPQDGSLHVICQSGNRSFQACLWLERNGRSAVNVAGGTGTWVMSGRPVQQVAA